MVVKPSIVIQIHLSKNHVDSIVIYLSHLHLIATLILYVVQLRDDKIPYFLRFSLFGKPAVGMIISDIQGNITEKVETKDSNTTHGKHVAGPQTPPIPARPRPPTACLQRILFPRISVLTHNPTENDRFSE